MSRTKARLQNPVLSRAFPGARGPQRGGSEEFYQDIMGLDQLGRDPVVDDGPASVLTTDAGHVVVLACDITYPGSGGEAKMVSCR